jgi:hypothetical protein
MPRNVSMPRNVVRVAATAPPAPGFIGQGHLAVEVLRPDSRGTSDPFVLLMDDRLEIESAKRSSRTMAMSMARLLIHSHAVPERVRDALALAETAPSERRAVELASAARLLCTETPLDCRDARELLGL